MNSTRQSPLQLLCESVAKKETTVQSIQSLCSKEIINLEYNNKSPLSWAISEKGNIKVIQHLIECGATFASNEYNAFIEAASYGRTDLLPYLKNLTWQNLTALDRAIHTGQVDTVKSLLETFPPAYRFKDLGEDGVKSWLIPTLRSGIDFMRKHPNNKTTLEILFDYLITLIKNPGANQEKLSDFLKIFGLLLSKYPEMGNDNKKTFGFIRDFLKAIATLPQEQQANMSQLIASSITQDNIQKFISFCLDHVAGRERSEQEETFNLILELLTFLKLDINMMLDKEFTLLHWAAYTGNAKMVSQLVNEMKADTSLKTNSYVRKNPDDNLTKIATLYVPNFQLKLKAKAWAQTEEKQRKKIANSSEEPAPLPLQEPLPAGLELAMFHKTALEIALIGMVQTQTLYKIELEKALVKTQAKPFAPIIKIETFVPIIDLLSRDIKPSEKASLDTTLKLCLEYAVEYCDASVKKYLESYQSSLQTTSATAPLTEQLKNLSLQRSSISAPGGKLAADSKQANNSTAIAMTSPNQATSTNLKPSGSKIFTFTGKIFKPVASSSTTTANVNIQNRRP